MGAAKAQIVTDGLVSYWPFDGNAEDAVGNNDGTIAGDTQMVAGKFGQALGLDGDGDYAEVPDSDSLDITDAITVEAWVTPDETSGYTTTFRTIAAKDVHTSQPYGFYWDDRNGELELVLNDAADRLTTAYDYVGKIGTWVHVAATYDKTEIKIYADGVLLGTKAYTPALPVDDASLWIGWDGDAGSDRYFKGVIDELRIYNRALSEAEINQNFISQGPTAVGPADKLALSWGGIKVSR